MNPSLASIAVRQTLAARSQNFPETAARKSK
jgi:hypothetical protein